MKQVGIEIPKVDVLEKALGEAKYGADLPSSKPLHLKVVRSPKAHARVVKVVTDEALRVQGVERVFTAKDIPGKNLIGIITKDHPVLASDRVRFVGDAVALVVARTEEAAEEAAAKVIVTYVDLPVISRPEEALRLGAPLIHEKGNLLLEFNVVKGDVQAGFKEADVIVEETYSTTWIEHAYLEPDAGLAYVDEEGRVMVTCPTQNVHYDQRDVATVLGVPLEKVRIIQCATGGGFGGRLDITVQCLLALAAFQLRKPVRIAYPREEVFQATAKRHPLTISYRSGAKEDGKLTAVEVNILCDRRGLRVVWGCGRHPLCRACDRALCRSSREGQESDGLYEQPMVRCDERFRSPSDRLCPRITNGPACSDSEDRPHRDSPSKRSTTGAETATGQTLMASVGIGETLKRIREWREHHPIARSDPERPYIRRGVGVGSMWYGIGNTGVANPSTAQVEIDSSGALRLFTGAADIGQGSDTVLLQIASESLGLPIHEIHLIRADTALTTDAGATSASRQTYISGNAILNAVKNLKQEAIKEASQLLKMDEKDLFYEEGKVKARTCLTTSIPIREVVRRSGRGLRGEGHFDPETTKLDPKTGQGVPYATFAFATHLAEVEVDTETGRVKVHRVVASHDVGKAINPGNVRGQITGGVAMGLGFALMEEFVPGETTSFVNYLIPTSKDIPEVVPILVEDTEPTGPFGAKGVGEPALIPTAPAILNAIADAIGERIYHLPANLERVRDAAEKSEKRKAHSA